MNPGMTLAHLAHPAHLWRTSRASGRTSRTRRAPCAPPRAPQDPLDPSTLSPSDPDDILPPWLRAARGARTCGRCGPCSRRRRSTRAGIPAFRLRAEVRRQSARSPVVEPGGRADGSRGRAALPAGQREVRAVPEVVPRASPPSRSQTTGARSLLDGEIVALDAQGEPAGFQQLQGRIHVTFAGGTRPSSRWPSFAFDLLLRTTATISVPAARRATRRASRVFRAGRAPPSFASASRCAATAEAMWEQAKARGWEGLISRSVLPPPTGRASGRPTG